MSAFALAFLFKFLMVINNYVQVNTDKAKETKMLQCKS